jgi:cation transport ATPase
VLGATMNVDGLFYMRVTGVGRDTALSQIVRLVEDAQTSKAPIQAYADQVLYMRLFNTTFCMQYALPYCIIVERAHTNYCLLDDDWLIMNCLRDDWLE